MWKLVGTHLDAAGVPHREVDLPTVGEGTDPALDFHADAAHVRAILDEIAGPVVLCGNSYGGVVITEASAGHPGVARLVYLAAYMPDADDNMLEFMSGNCCPEFLTAVTFRDDGLVEFDLEAERKMAFQQAPEDVTEWALSEARPMAMGTRGSQLVTGVGWRGIPSTYVVSGDDRSLQPEVQRRWALERATEYVETPFDHCPQLSHPAETADLLARLARLAAPG